MSKTKFYNLQKEGFPNHAIHIDGYVFSLKSGNHLKMSNDGRYTVALYDATISKTPKYFGYYKLYRKYFQNYIEDIPKEDKLLLSDISKIFYKNKLHRISTYKLKQFDNYYICKNRDINETVWSCDNYKWLKLDKSIVSSSGYYRVALSKNKKTIYMLLHRLLALAFVPIPDKYKHIPLNTLEVNHADIPNIDLDLPPEQRINKKNNKLKNLEWCTRSENHIHAYQNKLQRMDKATKQKISVANKGKIVSEETRKKISQSHIGLKPSEETRKKLSKLKKGFNNNFYGKKHNVNSKNLISAKVTEYYKQKYINTKHSEENKQKIIELYKQGGCSQRDLAKQFDVSKSWVAKITKGVLLKDKNIDDLDIINQRRIRAIAAYDNTHNNTKYSRENKQKIKELYSLDKYNTRQLADMFDVSISFVLKVTRENLTDEEMDNINKERKNLLNKTPTPNLRSKVSYTGSNNPFYGKTHSEETIRKIQEAKDLVAQKKYNNPNYSESCREEIRKLYATGEWFAKGLADKFGVSESFVYRALAKDKSLKDITKQHMCVGGRHTPESRQKLSESQKESWKKKLNNTKYGDNTKKQIRELYLNKKYNNQQIAGMFDVSVWFVWKCISEKPSLISQN